MKLLRISESSGYFLAANGGFNSIEKICKDDLLRLVGLVLEGEEIEMDKYDDQAIKNQAHQVIYKSIFLKLSELRGRRKEFVDEASRLYLDDYERYRDSSSI